MTAASYMHVISPLASSMRVGAELASGRGTVLSMRVGAELASGRGTVLSMRVGAEPASGRGTVLEEHCGLRVAAPVFVGSWALVKCVLDF